LARAQSADEVLDVFSDPSRLRIVPVLQAFVFEVQRSDHAQ
jgi:hypothetical protein